MFTVITGFWLLTSRGCSEMHGYPYFIIALYIAINGEGTLIQLGNLDLVFKGNRSIGPINQLPPYKLIRVCNYRKWGKIRWAKLSQFLRVLQKFFRKYLAIGYS